jgi:hypothetical protein
MADDVPPAKPRLEFRRGRPASAPAGARKGVPVEDALSRMAGKVGERRRAQDEARQPRAPDEGDPAF